MPTSAPNRSALHALAWLGWAIGSVTCIQLAPNPWYVAVVVVTAISIGRVHRRAGPMRSATRVLLTVGVIFATIRVTLISLTTHGVGEVLFTLPSVKLPVLLGGFTLGGTIEKPVVLQEMNSAWVVIGVLAVFGTFNAVVSHHELISLMPRAFHEVGVVFTIGLTFVPMIVKSVSAAREADVARTGGRAIRRGRTIRTLVPVVENAMERSVLLAESMDSRGFGRGKPTNRENAAAWVGLMAAVGLGGAVVALIGRRETLALFCAGFSVLALGAAVVLAAPAATRYRARRISASDAIILVFAAVTPVLMIIAARVSDSSLLWDVQAGAPPISALIVCCLALLCAPMAIKARA